MSASGHRDQAGYAAALLGGDYRAVRLARSVGPALNPATDGRQHHPAFPPRGGIFGKPRRKREHRLPAGGLEAAYPDL